METEPLAVCFPVKVVAFSFVEFFKNLLLVVFLFVSPKPGVEDVFPKLKFAYLTSISDSLAQTAAPARLLLLLFVNKV